MINKNMFKTKYLKYQEAKDLKNIANINIYKDICNELNIPINNKNLIKSTKIINTKRANQQIQKLFLKNIKANNQPALDLIIKIGKIINDYEKSYNYELGWNIEKINNLEPNLKPLTNQDILIALTK